VTDRDVVRRASSDSTFCTRDVTPNAAFFACTPGELSNSYAVSV
jgi:hypothetical protein